MSSRKAVVEAYFEGFRRSDHEQILGCLRFAYCDIFTFSGDRICRVESYVVPLK